MVGGGEGGPKRSNESRDPLDCASVALPKKIYRNPEKLQIKKVDSSLPPCELEKPVTPRSS